MVANKITSSTILHYYQLFGSYKVLVLVMITFRVCVCGGVRSGTVPHGPRSGPVRSTVRYGMGRHGPFLGEGRTDPPLDRTGTGHGPVHGPVRSGPRSRSGPGRVGPCGLFQISSWGTTWVLNLGYNYHIPCYYKSIVAFGMCTAVSTLFL
jgi:hypothetical protein